MNHMRVNVIQHTPNEGPGGIAKWSEQRGHQMYTYHPYAFAGKLPRIEQTDLLVLLGGPMGPYDHDKWLEQERILISEAMRKKIPILGVCLGAQQIAVTLGANVKAAPAKEVGFAPVSLKSKEITGLPASLVPLHWHQDMFELPDGAQLLYTGKILTNQSFVIPEQAIGLQFHLEPLPDNLREMVINDGDYVQGSVLGQSAGEILQHGIDQQNQLALFRMLDYLTKS